VERNLNANESPLQTKFLPTLAVILTNYNRSETIACALVAIASQEYYPDHSFDQRSDRICAIEGRFS
jgi:hypothetical protein